MELAIEKLQYRLYEEKDQQSILQLWAGESGWGAITIEQFEKWFLKTPYGPCLMVVAASNENEIVGQIIFYPAIIIINGVETKAFRGSAPILHPGYRQLSLNHPDHPAFGMIKFGFEQAKLLGYELVYSFPSLGWVPLLKAFPAYGLPYSHVAVYSCFSLSLESHIPEKDFDTRTILQTVFNADYDDLWEEAQKQFPLNCAVKRNAKWVTWKIGGHIVLEVRSLKFDKLIGYVAINKKSGLIVDMLARTKEDLNRVILSVIQYLHVSNTNRPAIPVQKLTGILSPHIKEALTGILYETEKYDFVFFCYALQGPQLYKYIEPNHWYIMPND